VLGPEISPPGGKPIISHRGRGLQWPTRQWCFSTRSLAWSREVASTSLVATPCFSSSAPTPLPEGKGCSRSDGLAVGGDGDTVGLEVGLSLPFKSEYRLVVARSRVAAGPASAAVRRQQQARGRGSAPRRGHDSLGQHRPAL